MNTTLEPYLKKLLDGGIKTAEEAVKFIEIQAPQLMHETIVWGSVSEMIAPLIGVLFIVVAAFIHKYLKPWGDDGYYNSKTEGPAVLITIIVAAIGIVIFLFNIMDVLYPIVAPRVFLLERISELIK